MKLLVTWTDSSYMDETWAKLTTLEVAACVLYTFAGVEQNREP
jgi:hypothetical protein